MKYNLSHTNKMEWDEFHNIVTSLIDKLSTLQKNNNFVFNAITPLMRSGAIPATMIANKMQIIPIIPLQVKHNYDHGGVDTIIPPICPLNIKKSAIKNILVVECNTYKGTSSKLTYTLLKNEFPDADIHYACVTKVFGGPERIDGYKSYHIGQWTNEAFKENAPKDARQGITIYPWETAEYELEDINA